jgi:hypothetical protein
MKSKITLTKKKSIQLLCKKRYSGLFNTTWLLMFILPLFMWQCKKDEVKDAIRPNVTSVTPSNSAINVALNSVSTATFSEEMDPVTIKSSTFTLMQGTTSVEGAVTYIDSVATFTPAAKLAASTVYTATITTGAKDLAGNALASNYIWSFTTGVAPDVTLPTVVSILPVNAAIGVAFNSKATATFSELMDPLTITGTTFTLKQGTISINGVVTYVGSLATFTPNANLTASTVYTATISTGAKDLAGNALANNYVWTFTTVAAPDITPPVVNSTNPLNNATGVVRNKVVAITFSEAMDPLTIINSTFTLMQGTTAVPGIVAYSGTTATFTSSAILLANTNYSATVTTGVKDLAGNALATNTVWRFTTLSTSTLATVNLGSAAKYVILAKTAISNIPTSAITGDLGLSPAATSYITGIPITNAIGYAISAQVTGKIYAADMADPTSNNLTTAVENMMTAYTDAAGRPTPDFLELATGNIGGRTLTPGLYKWTNTVTLPSDVTISGGANDVWIFQIAEDLTMDNAVRITLEGGAQAKNIFWQVAGTVTIGTTSHFEGIILSMTGITFQTGASFKGRALAQTAVTLDGNAITTP